MKLQIWNRRENKIVGNIISKFLFNAILTDHSETFKKPCKTFFAFKEYGTNGIHIHYYILGKELFVKHIASKKHMHYKMFYKPDMRRAISYFMKQSSRNMTIYDTMKYEVCLNKFMLQVNGQVIDLNLPSSKMKHFDDIPSKQVLCRFRSLNYIKFPNTFVLKYLFKNKIIYDYYIYKSMDYMLFEKLINGKMTKYKRNRKKYVVYHEIVNKLCEGIDCEIATHYFKRSRVPDLKRLLRKKYKPKRIYVRKFNGVWEIEEIKEVYVLCNLAPVKYSYKNGLLFVEDAKTYRELIGIGKERTGLSNSQISQLYFITSLEQS